MFVHAGFRQLPGVVDGSYNQWFRHRTARLRQSGPGLSDFVLDFRIGDGRTECLGGTLGGVTERRRDAAVVDSWGRYGNDGGGRLLKRLDGASCVLHVFSTILTVPLLTERFQLVSPDRRMGDILGHAVHAKGA